MKTAPFKHNGYYDLAKKPREIFAVNKIIIPRAESRSAAIRSCVFPYRIIFLSLNGIVNSKDWFKGNSLDAGYGGSEPVSPDM
jgi:hypothetical protein